MKIWELSRIKNIDYKLQAHNTRLYIAHNIIMGHVI